MASLLRPSRRANRQPWVRLVRQALDVLQARAGLAVIQALIQDQTPRTLLGEVSMGFVHGRQARGAPATSSQRAEVQALVLPKLMGLVLRHLAGPTLHANSILNMPIAEVIVCRNRGARYFAPLTIITRWHWRPGTRRVDR